ncbi:Ig-like domain-containing protein [Lacinutrix jangbogonensis]|uniref:Ig-like domain-containing protein n=1 Tax=Lacinutrix jangbogonensis TaxID=1469557 RepID=UPI00053E344D|nr:Ig-like domain-containing protein [Lacinutrix jangbogonensis]
MKTKITISKRFFLTFFTCCLFALSIKAQTAPVVVSTVPAHNESNAIKGAPIIATFDQPILPNLAVKRIRVENADTGSTFGSYGFLDSQVVISGNTLTLNITLPFDTEFWIKIDAGMVKNASNQTNPNYGYASGWLFSMESDTYIPILQAMSPPEGSVNVFEKNNLLRYFFNEKVQAGTGNILVKRVDDDSTTLNIDVANPANVSVTTSPPYEFIVIPTLGLDYSTEYYVEIPSGAIEDLAGNPFAGIGDPPLPDHDFTMRDDPDMIAPLANSFSPTDGAISVSTNTNLVINFNEDIQIGTGTIFVRNSSTLTTVQSISVATASIIGNTATIPLTSSLAPLTGYYIAISPGVFQDMAGNDFAGTLNSSTWNFTTINSDIIPPTANVFTPLDNATGVDIATNLSLVFSEPIQLIGTAILKDFGGMVIPSASTVSGSTLTINPTSNLLNSTQYYVELANGEIQDLAGNNYVGFSGNTTWNFTTAVAVDVTAPTISNLNPLDDATGVAIDANLVITFNESIQLKNGTQIQIRNGNGTLKESFVIPNANVTSSGSTVTINPTSDFANSSDYYISSSFSFVRDLAGNNFAGIVGATTWNFTTVAAVTDVTPPTVNTFTPLDNATEVNISNTLTLTFNETIQLTGGAVLKQFGGAIIPSSSAVSGSILTINPTLDLANNTQYYVEIANGVIKDVVGNSYTGFSGNSSWNFTTVAPVDITAPSPITFVPTDNSTEVNISNTLTLTFNETIQLTGGAVLKQFGGAIIPSSSAISGSILTINPTLDLANNTQYYVEIANGVIKDVIGNSYTGFSGNSSWNFTTVAPVDITAPSPITFVPTDNSTEVNISNTLTLTFNEPIQLIGEAVLKQFGGAIIPSSSAVSGSILTINPTLDLANNTQYYVEIANGVIKDVVGNNYTGFSGNSTWNFTTVAMADVTAPTITSLSPADNATNVSLSANLVLTADETIVRPVSGNIIIKNGPTTISTIPYGDASVDFTGDVMTVTGALSSLNYSTTYWVSVAGVKDLAGNILPGTNAVTWNFTTEEEPDITAPIVSSFLPLDNATEVSLTNTLTLTFNETIQLTGTAVLKQLGGTIIPSSSSVSGSVLTINPASSLINGTQYYVELASGVIQDLVGNNYTGFSGSSTWNFTTEVFVDVTAPTITSLSPADNATNVSLSDNLVLTADETIVRPVSGNIIIKNGPTTVSSIPYGDASVDFTGDVMTVTGALSSLNYSTTYWVSVAGVKDLAGNILPGTNAVTWNFTTGEEPDITGPIASSFLPLDNATEVSLTNNLTLTFNETIQLTGSAVLKQIGGAIIPSSSSVSGSVLTINPTSSLVHGTQYYVELASGVIQDLVGNNYAGFSGSSIWNFTTEIFVDVTAPTITSLSPADNATNVSLSANLVLTADENIVRPLSGNIIIKNGPTTVSIIPFGDASVDFTGTVMTVTGALSSLNYNTDYWVYVAGITDLAGNMLPETNAISWRLTTGAQPDTTAPTVSSYLPLDNATGVSVSNNLTLTFDENIQIPFGSAMLRNFNTNLEILSSSSISGNQLIINPMVDLDANTQYYVEIAGGIILDMSGNAYTGFLGSSTWSFTTESVLATENFNLTQHLSIFPNPTSGLLKVNISDYNEVYTVAVFDMIGKKVTSKTLNKNKNLLNIENLPSGIYLLKVTTPTKSYVTRIIKK